MPAWSCLEKTRVIQGGLWLEMMSCSWVAMEKVFRR